MTPPSPAAELLNSAASIIDWSEYDVPPATFGLSLVPDPPDCPDSPDGKHHEEGDDATECYHCGAKRFTLPVATPPARVSLRRHIEGVEGIADTIEGLDDETLSAEDRDELSALLIGAIAGTKKKVDDTSKVIAMYEALEAGAKREKERLAKREAFYARQIERLSDYVIATMTASKLPKLDGETSTLALRKNPPSVVIEAGATFSHEFTAYPEAPPPRPDKTAIGRALKAGRKVAGASLQTTHRLVRS